jgi:DNA mismatch repair protein MutL
VNDGARIRVLPAELADQIAAGEVVERPASVVKELCENALDAGARRIDIEVEAGGRGLVRVVDDGSGMAPADARLALLRHATSKLRAKEDLLRLTTMGFRGEALPSIAAVSRMRLVTRPAEEPAGWCIEVEGGHTRDQRPCGAQVGTTIEVRDLLWNMPARLKFLKSEPTEAAHITDAVERLALAFPAVHFRLRQGGRLTLDLPPASPLERAQAVLGRELFASAGEEHGIRITAFLAAPQVTGATTRGIHLYVDRRFVRDRGLGHAVAMGYGELTPRGRFPMAVLLLAPPEGSVDVNVHPQKVEVRFARAQEVYAATRHTVAAALARAPWLALAAATRATRTYAVPAVTAPYRTQVREAAAAYAGRAPLPLPLAPTSLAPAPAHTAKGGYFGQLRFVGQVHSTFLVLEGEGELVLIDQHAAHECVLYAELSAARGERPLAQQRLLFPLLIPATAAELGTASEHGDTLAALGFEIELFGGDSLAVKAVPEVLGKRDPKQLVTDVLAELVQGGQSAVVDAAESKLLATLACHAARRAGDAMGETEARALLAALDATPNRAHCPHGRPVQVQFSMAELARRFGRT